MAEPTSKITEKSLVSIGLAIALIVGPIPIFLKLGSFSEKVSNIEKFQAETVSVLREIRDRQDGDGRAIGKNEARIGFLEERIEKVERRLDAAGK